MSSHIPTSVSPVFKTITNPTPTKILESDFVYADSEYKNYLYGMINSTQQLDIDWSKFENHTFFNSAEANVNTAFDTIINKYPFDGTKLEMSEYLSELTGFEMYVLGKFPKNVGFLTFSGTSFIQINDIKDSNEIISGKVSNGLRVINPTNKSFSIEAHVFSPETANANQIICQKIEEDEFGFSLVLAESVDTENCEMQFIITSGTFQAQGEIDFDKGQFNHICAMYDRDINNIKILYNGVQRYPVDGTTPDYIEVDSINPISDYFLIGSGTSTRRPSYTDPSVGNFIPQENFDGYIDELRFFHTTRSLDDISMFGKKTIYQNEDLILYLKFNEPYDYENPDKTTDIILDSSGNSLHGRISNFSIGLRNTGSILETPVSYEDVSISHILFPQFTKIRDLNVELLTAARFYDDNNPNLITRLVPPHYFLEGMRTIKSNASGVGTLYDEYSKGDFPGDGKLGTSQLLTAILLTWGKYFDEIKMVIDAFSNVVHLNYDNAESAPDPFLPFISTYYGFDLPQFFGEATLPQYMYGEDLEKDYSTLSVSLKKVQDQLWKRILININDTYKSKGTINSIEALLRSAGIDADSLLRIREYGGNAKKGIIHSRQSKTETSTMLDFSGSLSGLALSATNSDGTYTNMPSVRSGYLSGSRIETGYPEPVGPFVEKPVAPADKDVGPYGMHGISESPHDGLFTSGSFTFEGIYSFPSIRDYPVTQSLMRLNTTGSESATLSRAVVANLLALSSSNLSDRHELKCFICPHDATSPDDDNIIELVLTGADIFDGNKWNIAIGRNRNDEINSEVSSSYFLKCARQSFGEVKEFYSTSAFFDERLGASRDDIFSTHSETLNSSGSFFTIGKQLLESVTGRFLNSDAITNPEHSAQALSSEFGGKVGHLRMWSKGFADDEWKEHVKNYTSLGVKSPFENFNFVSAMPGSFQRLRLDTSTDQAITGSDSSGNIDIFDYSQGSNFDPDLGADGTTLYLHLKGTGFEQNKSVIRPEVFHFGLISPKFDILQVQNKIRARGMEKKYNADESLNASHGVVHELAITSEFFDDPRFAIEFSSIDALNEDIIKMFSSLDVMNDILGAPNAMFGDSYRDLENLQQIYFERLTEKMKLDSYFELFKWFNSSFTTIIEQLIPRKTNYMGTNFIVESHMLERHKMQYLSDELYLKTSERTNVSSLDISIDGDLHNF